ncbi:MAG: hypothetical protein MUE42_02340 [Opitutaceae bacterium]|jgi:hypothetical protein|nr:hypothetical protein [Opitutaceae bacterium]
MDNVAIWRISGFVSFAIVLSSILTPAGIKMLEEIPMIAPSVVDSLDVARRVRPETLRRAAVGRSLTGWERGDIPRLKRYIDTKSQAWSTEDERLACLEWAATDIKLEAGASAAVESGAFFLSDRDRADRLAG